MGLHAFFVLLVFVLVFALSIRSIYLADRIFRKKEFQRMKSFMGDVATNPEAIYKKVSFSYSLAGSLGLVLVYLALAKILSLTAMANLYVLVAFSHQLHANRCITGKWY